MAVSSSSAREEGDAGASSSSSVTFPSGAECLVQDPKAKDPAELELANIQTWHINAPLLYDLYINIPLVCPALCVAWLPDVEGQLARLAFGTNTDRQNEVVVCQLQADQDLFLEEEPWRFCAADTSWADRGGFQNGFGFKIKEGYTSVLSMVTRLQHPTEVNRIAPCPHRPQLLATKAANGTVLLFDYERERDPKRVEPDPDACLEPPGAAVMDGFALNWSSVSSHYLVSGGNDGRCCLWDASVASKAALLHDFVAHEGALCDAAFSRHEANLLATVGDDRALHIWDVRGPLGSQCRSSSLTAAAEDEVLTVDWNHQTQHLLASAGKDQKVHVWDMRFPREPYKVLPGHTGDVVVVRWAPPNDKQSASILASSSMDATVIIWDIEAKEAEIAEEGNGANEDKDDDATIDMVPELLFKHTGHKGGVSDFSWNLMDRNLLCSVDEDQCLQIWQPQCSFDHLPPPSDISSAIDAEEISQGEALEEPLRASSTPEDSRSWQAVPRKRARIAPEIIQPVAPTADDAGPCSSHCSVEDGAR